MPLAEDARVWLPDEAGELADSDGVSITMNYLA